MATEGTPLLEGDQRPFLLRGAFRARFVTCVVSIAEGYDVGILNGAILLIKEDLQLSPWQVGFLLGIGFVAACISALASGSMADSVGRKKTIASGCALLTVGSLVMGFSEGFATLIIGRTVTFFGLGIGLSVVTTYMSEVAPAGQRGMFASLEELFLNVGIVLAFATSAILVGGRNWRLMLGLGAAAPACAAVLLCTDLIPESPRYLLLKGEIEQSNATLLDIHGTTPEVDAVLGSPRRAVLTWPEALKSLCGTRARAAMAGFGVAVLSLGTGSAIMTNTFSGYVLTKEGRVTDTEAVQMTMAMGCVRFAGLMFATLYGLDHCGRRTLLLLGCGIGAAAFAFLSLVVTHGLGPWWILSSFCLMSLGYSLGVGPTVFTYMAEVFDNGIRAKAVAVGVTMGRISGGIVSASIPIGIEASGVASVCTTFAAINLGFLAYAAAFCPETKQKTLEEIESCFSPA